MDVVRSRSKVVPLPPKPMLFAFAGLLVIGALLAILRGRATDAGLPAVARSSIWIDRVRRGDLVRQVPVQGILVPEHITWLSAVSAGRVAKRAVRPGAEVEPDTIVVVLANADLELAALEAERSAATAEALLIQLDVRTDAETKVAATSIATLQRELGDAERHAKAADRLAAEGLMSALDQADAKSKAKGLADKLTREDARLGALDSGRARQLAAHRAELARLREIAAFARRRVDALEIRAGVKGTVQDIPLENGQWAAVGTVLAKIAEPGRLKGEVRVSEAEAKDVHRGLAVRFENPIVRGRVERIDPIVARGSVKLEVTIDDPLPPGARADQTVSGYVEIEKLKNVLFVARPAGALDGSPASLLKLDADGRSATRLTAKLGRGSAREIEVLGGLAEGDEVIVSDVPVAQSAPRIRLL
jgi:HlyD family secretion protein